jgi:hypothetical protein
LKIVCAFGVLERPMGDVANLIGGPWIVCGFFTPDYFRWVDALRGDLDRLGAPYFFEAVEKDTRGWAAMTCRKPEAIRRALDRHPHRRIIWLDVDCRVHGNIAPLGEIEADFAVALRTGIRPDSEREQALLHYRGNMHPWSGTMVISPTQRALQLIDTWAELRKIALPTDTDETLLAVALGRVADINVRLLDHRWCATPQHQFPDAIIEHDTAGAAFRPTLAPPRPPPPRIKRMARELRRSMVSKILGRPYVEWKYGIGKT